MIDSNSQEFKNSGPYLETDGDLQAEQEFDGLSPLQRQLTQIQGKKKKSIDMKSGILNRTLTPNILQCPNGQLC